MHVRSRVVAIFGVTCGICTCGSGGACGPGSARVSDTTVVTITIDVGEITTGTILIDAVVRNLVGPRKCASFVVIAVSGWSPAVAVRITTDAFLAFVIPTSPDSQSEREPTDDP